MAKDYFDENELRGAQEMLSYLQGLFCDAVNHPKIESIMQTEQNLIRSLPDDLRQDYEAIIEDVKAQVEQGHQPENNKALQKRISIIMNDQNFKDAHAESNKAFNDNMAVEFAHIFGAPKGMRLN